MAPVMRISDHNWERLKMWATPLEDSPDDALGKVLDAAELKNGTFAERRPPDSNVDISDIFEKSASSSNLEAESIEGESQVGVNGGPAKIDRIPRGLKVPQSEYEIPILESLYSLGGKGRMQKVLDMVKEKMEHRFSDIEYQTLKNGSTKRWESTAQFARNALVLRGLLKRPEESGWGVWELTELGIAEVEKNSR